MSRLEKSEHWIITAHAFDQTIDIRLSDNEFKAFGGTEFTGRYDAQYQGDRGYDIHNFKQSINETGEKPGLITKIGKLGKVSHVNLHGAVKVTSPSAENVGTITGILDGDIQHCSSDVSIETDIREDYAGNIGGLVGSVSASGAVHESEYKQSISDALNLHLPFSSLKSGKELNLGGLIGSCAGVAEGSKAISAMTSSVSAASDSRISIGGFIGKLSASGQVTKSWSEALMTYTGNKENTAVGGFIGRIAGEIPEALAGKEKTLAEDCYAVLRGDNSGNLFIGAVDAAGEKLLAASACHALLMGQNGQPVYPEEGRIFGPGKAYENCYLYGESAEADSGITVLKEKYNELGSFGGFDEEVWEVINNVYPTLKNE